MKKKYKVLSLLKKIKKNNLVSSLGTLNNEKKKLEKINLELNELLTSSALKTGEIFFSSQLKNSSSFRQNLSEKIEISRNRENHIDKEISGYIGQIAKIDKQQEIVQKKIQEDIIIKQNEKEIRENQNFKIKNTL